MAPRCSNIVPRWAKMALKRLQKAPPPHEQSSKSDGGLFVFRLSRFLLKSLPRSPKNRQEAFQDEARSAILRSKLAILAPFSRPVGHLSAILAPTWPIWARRWAPRGSQKNLLLEAFCKYLVRHPKNSKMAPKMDLKWIEKASKINEKSWKSVTKWSQKMQNGFSIYRPHYSGPPGNINNERKSPGFLHL